MQLILRQLQIDKLVIEKFMKRIYFVPENHEILFKMMIEFLFYFCVNNTTNRLYLKHYTPYLIHLTINYELNAGALLAQILSADRLNSDG